MTPRGFGLYVHWPFCQAKCPYCDFNSHVAAHVDQAQWVEAFQAEISRFRDEFPNKTLTSIFFGGGTPSLMAPETVDAILIAARAAWSTSNSIEITLEANPTSVEAVRFKGYAEAGVNRVSIGVQALNNADLKALGRLHNVDEAKAAIETAKSCFDRINFDLIYARQHQTLADWKAELTEALALAQGHLSLYQLTIEDGTAFGDRFARGKLPGLPDEDLGADMFALTQELTEAAGLPAYEISNHATPGNESQHNLIYWRGHDWLGIGPGAHGRFSKDGTRIATEAHLNPGMWLNAVRQGSGDKLRDQISEKDALEERLMMGLRLREGISMDEFSKYNNKFNNLIDSRLLEHAEDRIRATEKGRPLLNAVLREILA